MMRVTWLNWSWYIDGIWYLIKQHLSLWLLRSYFWLDSSFLAKSFLAKRYYNFTTHQVLRQKCVWAIWWVLVFIKTYMHIYAYYFFRTYKETSDWFYWSWHSTPGTFLSLLTNLSVTFQCCTYKPVTCARWRAGKTVLLPSALTYRPEVGVFCLLIL